MGAALWWLEPWQGVDPTRERTPTLVYLSLEEQSQDAGFARYRRALAERWPPASIDGSIRHVQVSIDHSQALSGVMSRMLARPGTVLVAPTLTAARQAIAWRSGAAIVFATAIDPQASGLTQAIEQTGARATGVSLADDGHAKRLELLSESAPAIRRIGVLTDMAWQQSIDANGGLEEAAAKLGVQLIRANAESVDELEALLAGNDFDAADAWYIPRTYAADRYAAKLIEHLRQRGRLAMFTTQRDADRGAPMTYAMDVSAAWDILAELTLRVLGGEDPSRIPIERPRRYVFSVCPADVPGGRSTSTALLRRADRIC